MIHVNHLVSSFHKLSFEKPVIEFKSIFGEKQKKRG